MRNILVHVHEDDGQEARLAAALDLVRTFDGHLICVQVTPYYYYVASDPFGGYYALPELIEAETKREEEDRGRIEARLHGENISWDWIRYDGDASRCLVSAARLVDLIVLSQAVRPPAAQEPIPAVADVAIHARTPVLAVPRNTKGMNATGTAAVAWNGSLEASHALRFALPMLRRAAAVHIITVVEEGAGFPPTSACSYLSRYGINAELHEIHREERSVPDALLAGVSSVDADYLVMGAYGHTRLREFLLGGVTRSLIGGSPVPLLLAH